MIGDFESDAGFPWERSGGVAGEIINTVHIVLLQSSPFGDLTSRFRERLPSSGVSRWPEMILGPSVGAPP